MKKNLVYMVLVIIILHIYYSIASGQEEEKSGFANLLLALKKFKVRYVEKSSGSCPNVKKP